MSGRVGTFLLALSVAVTVFLVAPARVDSWHQNLYDDDCVLQQATVKDCAANQIRVDRDITWAWALGNRLSDTSDSYGQMTYRVHMLDILLDGLTALSLGILTFLVFNTWQRAGTDKTSRMKWKKMKQRLLHGAVAFFIALAVLSVAPARITKVDWSQPCNHVPMTGSAALGKCAGNKQDYVQWGWVYDRRVSLTNTNAFPISYRVHAVDVVLNALAAAIFGGGAYWILARRQHGRT